MAMLIPDDFDSNILLYKTETTIVWLMWGAGTQEYLEFTFYTPANFIGFREMMRFVKEMYTYVQENIYTTQNEAMHNFFNQKSSEVVNDLEDEYVISNPETLVDQPDFYVETHDENDLQCMAVIIPIYDLEQSLMTLREVYQLLLPFTACAGG